MLSQFTQSQLWAILPAQVSSVYNAFKSQLEFYANWPENSKKLNPAPENLAAFEPQSNDVLQGIPAAYTVENGVGILPIEGMVVPKSDIFTLFFGGFAALDILTRDFVEMVGREDIHTILLDINSPGGSAFGVQQFANIIYNARESKNIIAVTSGVMASAAQWIGSAAHKVYITGDVTVTGSIGTVTTHTDLSEAYRMIGVKNTEVAAGEFKRVPSSMEPLTTKGRLVLQDQVNHANRAFINDISKFKNVLASIVIAKMAEGKTFIGTQGIDVGLIDGLMTMDDILESVVSNEAALKFTGQIRVNNFNLSEGGSGMTIKEMVAQLKADSIDVYNAIVAEAKGIAKTEYDACLPDALKAEHAKGMEAGRAEGKVEGQAAEATRIKGIRELATAGNVDLIEKFIADGSTHAPEAAVEILKAQKAGKKTDLDALEKLSPNAIDADVTDTTDQSAKGMRQLVSEYMAEHKCSKGTAITACSKAYPDAKNDFITQAEKKQ